MKENYKTARSKQLILFISFIIIMIVTIVISHRKMRLINSINGIRFYCKRFSMWSTSVQSVSISGVCFDYIFCFSREIHELWGLCPRIRFNWIDWIQTDRMRVHRYTTHVIVISVRYDSHSNLFRGTATIFGTSIQYHRVFVMITQFIRVNDIAHRTQQILLPLDKFPYNFACKCTSYWWHLITS